MTAPSEKAPQRILVVDDEQQVCDILVEALTYMGHEVDLAEDGLVAVDKVTRKDFDLVVTDMDMPNMDGMELIQYLVENHKGIGIIAITGHAMRYQYTDVIAAGAADFITKPFSINELQAKLERILRERRLVEELERLAVKDPLTGLYNRRSFVKIAHKEAIRSVRYSHPLFLFFFDVDRFKHYNDSHGHQAGDNLLVALAEVLKSTVRKNVDTAFRYGGDEFTMLLPHLPVDQAMNVAERIRENFNRLEFSPTHLSIGIAQFRQTTGDIDRDIEDMVQRSDRALYLAKHHLGGNLAHMDNDL